jgi:2-polyprenyl-3-methyl-5-hydroxy-6-metoxy-1,4-benzoquinol methylase
MEPARLYKLFSSPDLEDLDSAESRDPFRIARSPKLDVKKQAVRDHFDACADRRVYWEQKAGAYYEDQARYYKFLIPEGLRVLEIGSGLGNLLAAVKPFRGVGIDLSSEMVKEATRRHPTLEFRVGDAETLDLDENFDVIILADVVGHLLDVEAALKRLRHTCTPQTRIIVSYYNYLWEPILRLSEKLGLKMPQP